MHTDSCWTEGYGHGLRGYVFTQERVPSSRLRRTCGCGACPGPGAFTASWHSSRADSVEWPPSSACQHGLQQGHSRSSGSVAPAAQIPAPTASVSPAGTREGPAAASGAPVPAGSHSGPGQGLDGCPVTLQRGGEPQHGLAPCRPQEPAQPPPQRPFPVQTFQDSDCPQSTREARDQKGSVVTAWSGYPTKLMCRLWDFPSTGGTGQLLIFVVAITIIVLKRQPWVTPEPISSSIKQWCVQGSTMPAGPGCHIHAPRAHTYKAHPCWVWGDVWLKSGSLASA